MFNPLDSLHMNQLQPSSGQASQEKRQPVSLASHDEVSFGYAKNPKEQKSSWLKNAMVTAVSIGVSIGATVVGGKFGGKKGAMAAGVAAAGLVNVANQKLVQHKEGIDKTSVGIDMALGLIPGGVGSAIGKKIAEKTSWKFLEAPLKRVAFESAVVGAGAGAIGSGAQEANAKIKAGEAITAGDLAKSSLTGLAMGGVLGGAIGGATHKMTGANLSGKVSQKADETVPETMDEAPISNNVPEVSAGDNTLPGSGSPEALTSGRASKASGTDSPEIAPIPPDEPIPNDATDNAVSSTHETSTRVRASNNIPDWLREPLLRDGLVIQEDGTLHVRGYLGGHKVEGVQAADGSSVSLVGDAYPLESGSVMQVSEFGGIEGELYCIQYDGPDTGANNLFANTKFHDFRMTDLIPSQNTQPFQFGEIAPNGRVIIREDGVFSSHIPGAPENEIMRSLEPGTHQLGHDMLVSDGTHYFISDSNSTPRMMQLHPMLPLSESPLVENGLSTQPDLLDIAGVSLENTHVHQYEDGSIALAFKPGAIRDLDAIYLPDMPYFLKNGEDFKITEALSFLLKDGKLDLLAHAPESIPSSIEPSVAPPSLNRHVLKTPFAIRDGQLTGHDHVSVYPDLPAFYESAKLENAGVKQAPVKLSADKKIDVCHGQILQFYDRDSGQNVLFRVEQTAGGHYDVTNLLTTRTAADVPSLVTNGIAFRGGFEPRLSEANGAFTLNYDFTVRNARTGQIEQYAAGDLAYPLPADRIRCMNQAGDAFKAEVVGGPGHYAIRSDNETIGAGLALDGQQTFAAYDPGLSIPPRQVESSNVSFYINETGILHTKGGNTPVKAGDTIYTETGPAYDVVLLQDGRLDIRPADHPPYGLSDPLDNKFAFRNQLLRLPNQSPGDQVPGHDGATVLGNQVVHYLDNIFNFSNTVQTVRCGDAVISIPPGHLQVIPEAYYQQSITHVDYPDAHGNTPPSILSSYRAEANSVAIKLKQVLIETKEGMLRRNHTYLPHEIDVENGFATKLYARSNNGNWDLNPDLQGRYDLKDTFRVDVQLPGSSRVIPFYYRENIPVGTGSDVTNGFVTKTSLKDFRQHVFHGL